MGWKARPQEAYEESKTEFINVDLDLDGALDLAPLVTALGAVHAIHEPEDAASFWILELDAVGLDFEATMVGFLDLIEALDEPGRRLWEQCSLRRLNVGIQAGLDPSKTLYSMPAPLVGRVARAGAEIIVTLYGARRTLRDS